MWLLGHRAAPISTIDHYSATDFLVSVLLIRGQPYNDHYLSDVLPLHGCAAPCFMGIRPGVTMSSDALSLLKANAWVSDVITANRNPEKPGQMWWVWNKIAPDYLKRDPVNPNFPVNGEVDSSGDVVTNILFQSGLTLGDIVLAKGLPSDSQLIFGGVILRPDRSVPAIIQIAYQADGFWASGSLKCPYPSDLWRTPAQLTITNAFNGLSLGTVRAIDRKTFLESIRRTSNIMCGL